MTKNPLLGGGAGLAEIWTSPRATPQYYPLVFTSYWLDFMTPLIYLNTLTKFTLSLGLYMFKGPYTVEWNYLMAATCAIVLPSVIIFLIAQRYLMEGIVMTGLKG